TISILKEIIPIETHQPPKYSEHDIKNVVVYTKVIPNKNKMNHTPCLKDTSTGKTYHEAYSQQASFSQTIQPKPRLFIFGAGVDVHPLETFAHQAGFNVTIWDWRQAFLKPLFFPNATLIHTSSVKEAFFKTGITSGDYAVVMTHDFQKDKEIM